MGIPVEKPKDFKGTFIRLFAYIRPYLGRIFIVLIAAIISTAFTIISPKVLGYAITRIFGNITNKQNDFLNQADFNYIKNILFILAGLYIVCLLYTSRCV